MSTHLGVANRLATSAFALRYFPKARSRLRDLAVVGTGRRGCLSFDVRHLQQTDLRLERSVASDSVLVFIVVLKLLDLSWAATE